MATITKRGDHQWQAKIRRRGYPAQSKTFERKSEAEAWAAVIESEMARSVFVDRSVAKRTTLEDVIKNYMRDVMPEKKGADVLETRLNRFLREETDLTVRFMDSLRVEDFEDYRDRRKKKKKKNGKLLEGSTVNRELNDLQSIIQQVCRRLNLAENPVKGVARLKGKGPRDVRLSSNDELKLLEAIDGARNRFLKPAVVLALETSMRRGELLSLEWDRIDWDSKTAHLPDTKTGDPRDVPLSSKAIQVLKELRDMPSDKVLEKLEEKFPNKVLKTSVQGLKNAYERARKRAGLEHINFHDLRHEATSRLVERGFGIEKTSVVTGHKDWRSLKRYTHLKASDVAKELG